MRNAGGYSLQYNGRNVQITVLDTVEDYYKLANVLVFDGTYVYYIKEKRVFVLKNIVIASGDFHYVSEEYDGLTLDEWITKQKLKEEEIARFIEERFDMSNRCKFEASQSSASIEEVVSFEPKTAEEIKKENPEWFETSHGSVSPSITEIVGMGFKNADTDEIVMELSVPTADELDNYFSSIGFNLTEVN